MKNAKRLVEVMLQYSSSPFEPVRKMTGFQELANWLHCLHE